MNKVERMLRELCPDGVEYRKLGEACILKRGIRVVRNELLENGSYAVYQNSLKPLGFYHKSNSPAETTFVITAGAAGEVGFAKEPIWAADDCLCITCPDNILNKYVYYFLLNNKVSLLQGVRRTTVPRLARTAIEQITLPVPPLSVQEEIIGILDRFTEYAASLQAELQARREQYEYYRERLLAPRGGDVRWVRLGEIGSFVRGNGLQKKDFTESGVGCIHYGQIYTHYGTSATETLSFCSPELAAKLKKARKGDVVIATTSENVEDVCKAVAWLGDEEVAIGGHECVFAHNQNSKYLSYCFQTDFFFNQKRKYAKGTKVVDIKTVELEKIEIPLPSLPEQLRIVGILDKFESLVNDLSQGLPAEISAVQEQYEYYRGRLLSFRRA